MDGRQGRRARGEAVAWAAAVAVDPAALFLDTETTGLGAEAEIVDVAVVDGDGRILLDTLVRPAGPIPVAATAIHGIRDQDVAAALRWTEVYPRLLPILAGRRVVVYNAAFDRRMVGLCCDRYGLPSPAAVWDCAMLRFARFQGAAGRRGSAYRCHSLAAAARSFGAEPGGHRAAGDALACRHVVLGMARYGSS